MGVPSEIIGIHQGDVIVRTGIMAAIEDLRANDWLLDDCFNSLPNDMLTKEAYGQNEVDRAKQWFRSTKIPVMMSTAIVDASFPIITMSVVDSAEAETTIGDTHYVPEQDDDRTWPALTPIFEAFYVPPGATSFAAPANGFPYELPVTLDGNPATITVNSGDLAPGTLIVPPGVSAALVLAPGMQIIDREGVAHEILTVIDDSTVTINPVTADFSKTVIKGKPPSSITIIGSVKHKETYAVGCHVQGEQTHLIYLHTILVFCLYRYKKRLFEARGFERHVITSSDFRRNEQFDPELTFSRHLNLTGYVPQVWPEETNAKITAVESLTVVDGAGTQEDPDQQLWVGEEDALTLGLKMFGK